MSYEGESLSPWEKMREQNIAEQKLLWKDLMEAKEEYDVETMKPKAKAKKIEVSDNMPLRRSSRNQLKVNYTEDCTGKCARLRVHSINEKKKTLVVISG